MTLDFSAVRIGPREHLHPLAKKVYYVAVWKRYRSDEITRPMDLCQLGLFESIDQFRTVIEHKVNTDGDFRRKYAGGHIAPLQLSDAIFLDPALAL